MATEKHTPTPKDQIDGEVSLTLYDLETGLHDAITQAMEAQDAMRAAEQGMDFAHEACDDAKYDEYNKRHEEAQDQFEESQQVVRAYLNSAVEKRDRVARFLAHLDSQATLAGDEIRRLQDRKRRMENAASSLKGHIVYLMQGMGVRKLEGETSTLSLRKSPGHVEVTDLTKVPNDYTKREWVVTPMKKELGAALKGLGEDEEIPGAKWVGGGDYLKVT